MVGLNLSYIQEFYASWGILRDEFLAWSRNARCLSKEGTTIELKEMNEKDIFGSPNYLWCGNLKVFGERKVRVALYI